MKINFAFIFDLIFVQNMVQIGTKSTTFWNTWNSTQERPKLQSVVWTQKSNFRFGKTKTNIKAETDIKVCQCSLAYNFFAKNSNVVCHYLIGFICLSQSQQKVKIKFCCCPALIVGRGAQFVYFCIFSRRKVGWSKFVNVP